jgi:hypothetical protein
MTSTVQVVALLDDALIWRILRKYANSTPAVGSQLRPSSGDPERMDCACTVGQKLARCPLIEHVLWAQEAADWLRNVWQPAIGNPHHGRIPNPYREHPALMREVLKFHWSARMAETWANRAQHRGEFRWQWTLIVCELSAAFVSDYSFREWISPTMLERTEARR